MSEIEQYQPAPAPALRVAPETPSFLPATAHALVEWASSARAAYELADMLTGTAFCPQQYRGKPHEAAAAMLAGAEVGLSPMASLRSFDNIQGTAAPKALTLRAVVQAAGHEIVQVSATSTEVLMRGRRRGSKEWQEVRWTIARARQMGLAEKQQWRAQPTAMLIARATSELARLVAADAILGIGYSAEEVADAEPEPTAVVQRAPSARRTVQRAAPRQAEEPNLDETPAVVEQAVDEVVAAQADEPPAPEPATKAQVQRLNIHLRGQVGDDRDAKLAWLTEAVGRPITSSSELTKAEAHRLIDQLDTAATSDPVEDPMTGAEADGEERDAHWSEGPNR